MITRLETERLILRKPIPADYPAWEAFSLDNRSQYIRGEATVGESSVVGLTGLAVQEGRPESGAAVVLTASARRHVSIPAPQAIAHEAFTVSTH